MEGGGEMSDKELVVGHVKQLTEEKYPTANAAGSGTFYPESYVADLRRQLKEAQTLCEEEGEHAGKIIDALRRQLAILQDVHNDTIEAWRVDQDKLTAASIREARLREALRYAEFEMSGCPEDHDDIRKKIGSLLGMGCWTCVNGHNNDHCNLAPDGTHMCATEGCKAEAELSAAPDDGVMKKWGADLTFARDAIREMLTYPAATRQLGPIVFDHLEGSVYRLDELLHELGAV
jgi:hypothetical protein